MSSLILGRAGTSQLDPPVSCAAFDRGIGFTWPRSAEATRAKALGIGALADKTGLNGLGPSLGERLFAEGPMLSVCPSIERFQWGCRASIPAIPCSVRSDVGLRSAVAKAKLTPGSSARHTEPSARSTTTSAAGAPLSPVSSTRTVCSVSRPVTTLRMSGWVLSARTQNSCSRCRSWKENRPRRRNAGTVARRPLTSSGNGSGCDTRARVPFRVTRPCPKPPSAGMALPNPASAPPRRSD